MTAPDAPGWLAAAVRRELAGDASRRRYFRLEGAGGRTAVRVEYPAGEADRLRTDLEVLRWFARRGIRVPRILDVSGDPPSAVLEDFGPDDAEAVLRRTPPAERLAAVPELIRPLAVLAAVPPDDLPRWNRPLDAARLREELAGFEHWYLRAWLGRRTGPATAAWLDRLAARVGRHPRRVCHRDFHLNNLFLLPGRSPGVIDVQDVLVGPDTYDVASLVGERAFPELLGEAGRRVALERWAEETSPAAGWRSRFEEALLQRGLKVLGTFARLTLEGRNGYRGWILPLARRLAGPAERLGAPGPVMESLLYSEP